MSGRASRWWMRLLRPLAAQRNCPVLPPVGALEMARWAPDPGVSQPDKVFSVPVLLPNGERVPGEFRVWEQSPENAEEVLVVLRFSDQVYHASSAEHFFEALNLIRRQLEPHGILPDCFGCSRNVYPSPMSLSMGYGEKAVLMRMGQPTREEDQGSIFGTRPGTEPVTVAEQERFYEEWVGSLRRTEG